MRIFWCLMVLVSLNSLAWASQRAQVKEANQLFKKQKWDAAIDHYLNALESKENVHIVQYDLGTAFYKQGNYDQSIEHLRRAISDKNKDLSSKAYYNLGNAYYKKAATLEDKKIDEAIHNLQESLSYYEKVLSRNAKDKDAHYNRQVVEKELERLKKKKEEQKSKESDQKNSSEQNKQNDQKQEKSETQNKDKENKAKDRATVWGEGGSGLVAARDMNEP